MFFCENKKIEICFLTLKGTIQSPNYPDVYPPQSDCEWLIDTQLGNTVNLYWEVFDLEGSGTSCYYDFVRVYDGPNATYPLLGRVRKQLVFKHFLQYFLKYFITSRGTSVSKIYIEKMCVERDSVPRRVKCIF